jgi:hypothetical protein
MPVQSRGGPLQQAVGHVVQFYQVGRQAT